jgi:hypothetical protein
MPDTLHSMTLPEYLADVAKAMQVRSESIRRDFATHQPSDGTNLEHLIREFLTEHLPKRFSIDTGLMISGEGQFSNQADLIVADGLRNAPLYPREPNKLWPVESVYALVEAKAYLSPTAIAEAVSKGRRFKTLKRSFLPTAEPRGTDDSLFVIWGYDSAQPAKLKENLLDALAGIPKGEQPDLVVVPNLLVARAGTYLEVGRIGAPNTKYRAQMHEAHGADLSALLPAPVEVQAFGPNALLAWFVWLDSWLRHAGPRSYDPVQYIPPGSYEGPLV